MVLLVKVSVTKKDDAPPPPCEVCKSRVLMSTLIPLVTACVVTRLNFKSTYAAEIPTAAVPAVVKPVMLLIAALSYTVPIGCVLMADPAWS